MSMCLNVTSNVVKCNGVASLHRPEHEEKVIKANATMVSTRSSPARRTDVFVVKLYIKLLWTPLQC